MKQESMLQVPSALVPPGKKKKSSMCVCLKSDGRYKTMNINSWKIIFDSKQTCQYLETGDGKRLFYIYIYSSLQHLSEVVKCFPYAKDFNFLFSATLKGVWKLLVICYSFF